VALLFGIGVVDDEGQGGTGPDRSVSLAFSSVAAYFNPAAGTTERCTGAPRAFDADR
jgi:hypothetical protein